MSIAAPLGDPVARPRPKRRPRVTPDLAEQLIVAFATAEDVATGMTRVIALARTLPGVGRVEWWAPADNGRSQRLEAADGSGGGLRTAFELGPVGTLLVAGAGWAPQLADVLSGLTPLLRRRWTEERLACHAALLARRVEALEDFAALLAHELKAPLGAAVRSDDPAQGAAAALALVDSVLEAVRCETDATVHASPVACLEQALDDLGEVDAEVVASLPETLPLPPSALRLLLRNLISNAVAARARHVRVSAITGATGSTLVVEDDGIGLAARDRYDAGSRLGLSLCSRLAGRLGGVLELEPRPGGGTCALLVFASR
ncbi:MAG TPA: HAMP domain-containing sensor histidine kinase [Gaiellaceae bacterium]|nr:HAMP domain-containing sensor histidine kinase [Gaiellaceae bacterium]